LKNWKDNLLSKGFLIADGAWGTEMMKRGLSSGECAELWNLSRPDDVRAIARAYREAGANIILTNTFGANPIKLKRAGILHLVGEINRRGVELSREVAGDSLVFASIGPTGEFMRPLGTLTEDEMIACFAEQVRAFVEGGADGVIIETMSDLNEAKCAVKAVKENSALTIAVSMTFSRTKAGFATMMGITPEQAAVELEKTGADIVGSNCGSGIEDIIEVIRIMRSATSLPLWAKPNAGVPQLEEGRPVYKQSPEEMASFVPELIKAGANIIGGCCGTTPQHIKLIVEKSRSCADIARRHLTHLKL